MSFQSYLDNIKTKTGKTPDDFKKLAVKKGFLKEGVKAGEIVGWLKKDFDLGHGHAMAIYSLLKGAKEKKETVEKNMAKHFAGGKSFWQPVFDSLLNNLKEFGDDIAVAPTNSYLSILRGERKMAIVRITSSHMEIGIKLKGVASTKRFNSADSWNTMMTHRVQVTSEKQVDKELMNWLRSAYEQNGGSM
ncbi:MAG: DUF4287 domain-containing protein [Bacteroidetes bacterium]|nr:DUF4287 domain-containing protein [Bacteroidota bacterium]